MPGRIDKKEGSGRIIHQVHLYLLIIGNGIDFLA
jgi:hypothetical protein